MQAYTQTEMNSRCDLKQSHSRISNAEENIFLIAACSQNTHLVMLISGIQRFFDNLHMESGRYARPVAIWRSMEKSQWRYAAIGSSVAFGLLWLRNKKTALQCGPGACPEPLCQLERFRPMKAHRSLISQPTSSPSALSPRHSGHSVTETSASERASEGGQGETLVSSTQLARS